MAFFDNIGKKLSQTSQDVVKKTKETAEIIRLNGVISEQQKALNSVYQELGKLYCEQNAISPEKEYEQFVVSASEIKQRIEEISEQIKQLKGIVPCPNCGGDVPYGASFCSMCGYSIPKKVISDNNNTVVCSNCGTKLSDNIKFCTACGNPVTATENNNSINEVSSVDDSVAVAQEDTSENRCPKCGSIMTKNLAFCTECGTKLE